MAGDVRDPDLELIERSLEKPDYCGVTRIIEGREWICVRSVHDDPPRPRHGQRSQQPQNGYYPRSERHYFRRRYPHSDH